MNWVIDYLPEARKDIQGLDHSVQTQVLKGIRKVAKNPVSVNEGGYGKPLGNKNGNDLTGLFKIKFHISGIPDRTNGWDCLCSYYAILDTAYCAFSEGSRIRCGVPI